MSILYSTFLVPGKFGTRLYQISFSMCSVHFLVEIEEGQFPKIELEFPNYVQTGASYDWFRVACTIDYRCDNEKKTS